MPNYRVAGKHRHGAVGRNPETGVRRILGVSSAGSLTDNPRFTVYVVLHNPTVDGVAARQVSPVFSKVMSFALRRYAVQPTGTKPSRLPVEWSAWGR